MVQRRSLATAFIALGNTIYLGCALVALRHRGEAVPDVLLADGGCVFLRRQGN
ncbi:MAG: hypothetical protein JOZ17_00250, partial [Acetobacteraceae bacterium]|nr:hypothetical protein [Acetobacteraceae bacterium]